MLCGAHNLQEKIKYSEYMKTKSACEKVGDQLLQSNLWNELNKIKTSFSVQLEISLNFEIKNKILKTFLVNFLTISGSFKDFDFFLLKNGGGSPFFFGWNPNIFVKSGAYVKFRNPTTKNLRELSQPQERFAPKFIIFLKFKKKYYKEVS